MRCFGFLRTVAVASAVTIAQQPQTSLCGVVNGVTLQSAPATVAQGGILAVFGRDLAGELAQAEALPLPTSLGDPAVQVFVNKIAWPLFFVSPARSTRRFRGQSKPVQPLSSCGAAMQAVRRCP